MNSIRNKILDAILTDDSYTPKQDQEIIRIYSSLKPTEKAALDKLFISLCGYSLHTLTAEFMINSEISKSTDSHIQPHF